ncbi:phosphatidate cytidylyltransferase [Oscillospiraceae bacterium OttesenSCG-928-G22]|nr:phosphatidate cytidylyltransferase [Oscillospiraceae bacterium OttesenSCG-928-G22]
MGVRVIAGFLLVVAVLALTLFAPPYLLPIVIALVSALAVQELLWTTGFVRKKRHLVAALVMAILIPPWVYFGSYERGAVLMLFLFVFFLFLEGITGSKDMSFEKISGIIFAATIVPYFLSSMLRLMALPIGKLNLLFMFITAFGSDAMALFAGMLFGKHKLAPDISPKKTVEGAIGGLVMSPVLLVIFSFVLGRMYGLETNYLLLVVYGFSGAFVSQIGDLAMSFIKRQYHIKDFGELIPGHGGILDRFDSVLFAAPFLEILFFLAPVFTMPVA